MNTSKNNIEYQIKKQIDEREIAPSRDLWSEIEAQVQINSHSNTKKINWFLVAACVVLTLSLGAVLFFNQNSTPSVQVAKTDNSKIIKENPVKIEKIHSPESTRQNQERYVEVKHIFPLKSESSEISTDKKELPIIREDAKNIAIQISQIPAEKILAKADSAKTQVKKKRYVDPSTLLFSVEHKDVIEKTKGGSNVATIDLNTK